MTEMINTIIIAGIVIGIVILAAILWVVIYKEVTVVVKNYGGKNGGGGGGGNIVDPLDVTVINEDPIDVNVVTTIDDPVNVNVVTDSPLEVILPSMGNDAFGRLRTASPFTVFDSSFRYGDSYFHWDTERTEGTEFTFLENESAFRLYVPADSNAYVLRQTKHVFEYQPGKSLLILATFVMDKSDNRPTQRVGYYNDDNGIFFETNSNGENGGNSFVIRSFTSGIPVDIRVPQADWNVNKYNLDVDPINNLDISKTQIFWIDLQWLGVGSVRCGFFKDGKYLHCHTFNHANLLTEVYMQTAVLPIRYEILGTSTSTAGSMKQICSTVISEGGYSNLGVPRSIGRDIISGGTIEITGFDFYPIISIRLKSDNIDAIVVPKAASILASNNSNYAWRVFYNAALFKLNGDNEVVTVVDTDWSSVANSSVEYCINALTLGYRLNDETKTTDEGYFVGGAKGGEINIINSENIFSGQIGRKIDNTSDIYTIAVSALGQPNQDIFGSISWNEHTFSTIIT